MRSGHRKAYLQLLDEFQPNSFLAEIISLCVHISRLAVKHLPGSSATNCWRLAEAVTTSFFNSKYTTVCVNDAAVSCV